MRSRYQVHDSTLAHFVTCTIIEWLPVFTTAKACEIITSSLLYSREHKALKIHGWVILDNHFHAILSAPDLSKTLADFKSFTARQIITHLKEIRSEWLLNQLEYYRKAHKTKSLYQVWQEGSHPQCIRSDETMFQKLEYLHNNPVKRGLVVAPEHWVYSSAHEWLPGSHPLLRCDTWKS